MTTWNQESHRVWTDALIYGYLLVDMRGLKSNSRLKIVQRSAWNSIREDPCHGRHGSRKPIVSVGCNLRRNLVVKCTDVSGPGRDTETSPLSGVTVTRLLSDPVRERSRSIKSSTKSRARELWGASMIGDPMSSFTCPVSDGNSPRVGS